MNIEMIGPMSIKNRIEQLFDVYDYHLLNKINEYIQFIELNPNQILEIAKIGYKIQSFPVIHGNEKPSYGYIIDDKLGFTGDSSLCEGVENIVNNSKVIIADCSRIVGDESHMGIDNLEYLIQKYNKTIIATHINEETREELNARKINNILVKEDGYTMQL